MPYYGYARQDRKVAPRTPITAKLIAELLEASGVNRVVVGRSARWSDPGLLQHPMSITSVRHARACSTAHLREHYTGAVVVSPDAGGVERARAYSKRLNGTLAMPSSGSRR